MENELLELERKYESRRRENSFYIDTGTANLYQGSPNILGDFTRYTYHIDRASKKIMQTELSFDTL